jgi:hypothetical protein
LFQLTEEQLFLDPHAREENADHEFRAHRVDLLNCDVSRSFI